MRVRSVMTSDRDLGESQTMTPMIDIVFLLLVFFVCVATDQVVEMSLPTELAAGGIAAPQSVPQQTWVTEVRVRIFREAGQPASLIAMNGRTFSSYAEFAPVLKALAGVSKESPILLNVEDDVPLGDLIQVYDACRVAEFDRINFVLDRPEVIRKD